MHIAKSINDYRLKEIANAFGLSHYGAVAHAIYKLSSQLLDSPELGFKLKAIIKKLGP